MRDEHALEPRAVRREDLLFHAAHGQHAAAQRDLARHPDVGFDRAVEQQRGDGREHRHPGAGAVFGDSALRDVHVQIDELEPLVRRASRRSARERTNDTAVVADSCITLRMLPVNVVFPLPGIFEASMKRIWPPAGVHARPVATPGSPLRSAIFGSVLVRAEHLLDELGDHRLVHVFAFGEAHRDVRGTSRRSRARGYERLLRACSGR